MRSHGFQREERGDQSSLTEQANVKPYPPPQGETEARERLSLASVSPWGGGVQLHAGWEK